MVTLIILGLVAINHKVLVQRRLTLIMPIIISIIAYYITGSHFYNVLVPNLFFLFDLIRMISIIDDTPLDKNEILFAVCLFSALGLAAAEWLVWKYTGEHSRLFTYLIYDPNLSVSPLQPNSPLYSSFEYTISWELMFIYFISLLGIIVFIYFIYLMLTFINFHSVPYMAKRSFYYLLIFFCVFLLISIKFLSSPFLILIMIIILAGIQGLSLFRFNSRLFTISTFILNKSLHLLSVTGLLQLCYFIYDFFNGMLSDRYHKIIMLYLGICFLIFLIINKYIMFLRIEHQSIPFLLYLIYIIFFSLFTLRFFINFSLFIIPHTFNTESCYSHLLLVEVHSVEDTASKPNKPLYFGRFLNRNNHYHEHFYYGIPRSNLIRNIGIGIGLSSLGLGVYACVQYKRSADAAVRSADAAEVAAGLRSVESYKEKHGPLSTIMEDYFDLTLIALYLFSLIFVFSLSLLLLKNKYK